MTTMPFSRILAAALLCTVAGDARVTRLNIEKREATATHETLSGHVSGELDPKDPHNAIITDIQLAPRNAKGMVEVTVQPSKRPHLIKSEESCIWAWLFETKPGKLNV